MDKAKAMDKVHECIHACRLIPDYKPNPIERVYSNLVLEVYGETCEDCKAVKEKNKALPQAAQEKGIMGKLGELFK